MPNRVPTYSASKYRIHSVGELKKMVILNFSIATQWPQHCLARLVDTRPSYRAQIHSMATPPLHVGTDRKITTTLPLKMTIIMSSNLHMQAQLQRTEECTIQYKGRT